MEETQKTTVKNGFQAFMKSLPRFISKLVQFGGIILAVGLVITSVLTLYSVLLEENVIRDIEGPVARYVANVDFAKRHVMFDTTFSKTKDSPAKITIWRMGDGHVVKSSNTSDINAHEILDYTFKEPGTYTIGYSIIDTNDLSDEATCVITFKDASNPKSTNSVSSDCGKSSTSYQSINSVFSMNHTRDEIRGALMALGVAAMLLVGIFVFKKVFAKYFENQ